MIIGDQNLYNKYYIFKSRKHTGFSLRSFIALIEKIKKSRRLLILLWQEL